MTAAGGPVFEIALREDARFPTPRSRRLYWRPALLVLPALLCTVPVVVLPLALTAWASLGRSGGGIGIDNYLTILADPSVRHALRNSALWMAVAPLVCVVGLALAHLGRGRLRVLFVTAVAAPAVVSALVCAFSFRLTFDPDPHRGVVAAAVDGLRGGPQDGALAGLLPADPAGTGGTGPPAPAPAPPMTTSGDDIETLETSVRAGEPVVLLLTRVSGPGQGCGDPPAPRPGTATLPGELGGLVCVDGRPAPAGLPVVAFTPGTDRAGRATTGPGGTFTIALPPHQTGGVYGLRLPGVAAPARGTNLPFLSPGWIGLMLGLAFAWQWIGFALVIFRAALAGVPRDLERMARSFGVGRLRTLWTVRWPALFPATALVLLTVVVAAVRVFDLVLVAAPGSSQAAADTLGLHWWRWRGDLGAGGAAALAMLLFLIVAAVALLGLWGLSRDWPVGRPAPEAAGDAPAGRRAGGPGRRVARWSLRALAGLVAVAWLLPFAVLVLTSLRDPGDAGRGGFWSGDHGFGLDSYREALAGGELLGALGATLGRALVTTVLLVLVAAPAAYALAWRGLPRPAVRTAVGVTAVLAVVPPQALAGPLDGVFERAHLFGAPTALTVVHVALGVPFAVLLLRAAFVNVPLETVRRAQRSGEPAALARAVLWAARPALVTVAVLESVLVWNDLIVGLLLGGPGTGQLALTLYAQARELATASGPLAAGALVMTVPPLALVLLTGRWVVRGLTGGVAG